MKKYEIIEFITDEVTHENSLKSIVNNNWYKLIKDKVKYAIENELDYIIFLKNIEDLSYLEVNQIHNNFQLLNKQGVYSLLWKRKIDKHIPISRYLSVIEQIENVDGFIFSADLFCLLSDLNFINAFKSLDQIFNMNNFLTYLHPSKFFFTPQILDLDTINKNTFHIIIPFRNVEKYIQACTESILTQEYGNYRIYFIDDNSEDDSFYKIPDENRITKYKNSIRQFALRNIITIIQNENFTDSDIICLLDGDDKFSHPYIFNILNEIYKSKTTNLTYGSYSFFDDLTLYGSEYNLEEFNNIRKSVWKASHLKTFRYGIFKDLLKIDPELNCMRDQYGDFIKMPYDMAIMFPLLEIAGFNGCRFINCVLYNYRLHDENDHVICRNSQQEGELMLRNKDSLL